MLDLACAALREAAGGRRPLLLATEGPTGGAVSSGARGA
jgi:hypothetical protein